MEVDGLHPDDVGYTLMAQAWYKGLLEAKSKGWINGVASGAAFMGGAGWLMWFLVVSLVLLVGV
jgi:hypothetical protein